VLAYDFTENHQFATKTERTSVFLGREPHIPDRLYIMVLYMSFYEFSYISNFRSKSIGVGLWFNRKSPVCDKNDQNSVFLSCEAHILDRLYIMVPYMSPYGF
jgi:hypothetical protein